ncbi:hypothetical protein AB0J21_05730 [Streptomyces sp. NPDC049954]|uniref:hypothetical protein n=1 Tax=Streptomyces sp. NPDC049954 TaxID=3155779 RepID=UPI00343C0D0D
MHGIGPGPVPPRSRRPSTAALAVERTGLTLVSLCALGFLSWISLLRAASVTRRRAGWFALWCSVACAVLGTVFVAADPGSDEIEGWQGNVGMVLLLLNAFAGTAYYLYSDIRYRATAASPPGLVGVSAHAPGHYPAPGTYAPAAPAGPYAPTAHGFPARPASGYPQPLPAPVPLSAPYPGRIDQVRAELDELSAYLRAEEAGRTPADGPSDQVPSDQVPSDQVPSDHVPSGYGPSDHVPSGHGPSPSGPAPSGTAPEYPGAHGWAPDSPDGTTSR